MGRSVTKGVKDMESALKNAKQNLQRAVRAYLTAYRTNASTKTKTRLSADVGQARRQLISIQSKEKTNG